MKSTLYASASAIILLCAGNALAFSEIQPAPPKMVRLDTAPPKLSPEPEPMIDMTPYFYDEGVLPRMSRLDVLTPKAGRATKFTVKREEAAIVLDGNDFFFHDVEVALTEQAIAFREHREFSLEKPINAMDSTDEALAAELAD